MKKKIISLLLALAMLISLMPGMAFTAKAVAAGIGTRKMEGGKRDFRWPVPNNYGISGCYMDQRAHYAIDIPAVKGTGVVAAYPGTVVATYTSCTHNYSKTSRCCGDGFGNYVVLSHNYLLSDGSTVTLYSRYSHLTAVSVSNGQSVSAGTQVGTIGSTGYSQGNHVDFQILKGGWKDRATYGLDPYLNDLLELPFGLKAACSSSCAGVGPTACCCYEYIKYVKNLYATPLVTSVYLDVNGYLDGADSGGLSNYGTFDVWINGSLVSNDVADFWEQWPVGSKYEITDIKASGIHKYLGIREGSLSGTIHDGGTNVRLQFRTLDNIGDDFYAYIISKNTGNGLFAQDDLNATFISKEPTTHEVWHFERQEDGTYKITSAYNGYSLDVRDCGTTQGTNLILWPYSGNTAQQWCIFEENGWCTISAVCTPCVIWEDAATTNAQMMNDSGSAAQWFQIQKVELSYPIDVNANINGTEFSDTQGRATFDVWINGVLEADDVTDFSRNLTIGTIYEIRDIRIGDDYCYNGLTGGTLSGVVDAAPVRIVMDLSDPSFNGIGSPAAEAELGGSRYLYYPAQVSWYTAKAFCERQGGHLITVGSVAEYEIAKALAGTDSVWLGASDAAEEGVWEWVTGEPFAFADWVEGEPNQQMNDKEGGENYLMFYEAGWNDVYGTAAYGFICELCSHDYLPAYIDATCVDYGYTIYTCTLCGDTYTVYEGDYTEWSTTKPSGVAEDLIETKTQYRYADKETTTSYEPSLSGWTQVSGEWKQSGSGSVQYVKSWPSGFDTSHSLYSTYNKSPKSNTETTTDKTTINSDKVSGYLYYHWCRGTYTAGPIDRGSKATKQSPFVAFHAFYSTTNPNTLNAAPDNDGSYRYENGNCCKDTYWYFYTPVNTQTYTTYRKLFTYERWGNWSDWTDNVYTASASRKVESRTMYRTVIGQLGDHSWNSGVVTTPADCTHDGVKTYTCTHCGETKTAAIPKTGHDYEDGYCTSCGAVDPDYNFVPVVLTVGEITGYPGDTVTVPVSISGNSGFAGFTLAIGWDQKSIQLTNIAKGALLNTSESGAFTKNVSGGTVNWVDPVNITGNGELLLLTFKISEQAQAGAYGVTLALKDGNTANFANENSRPVRAEFVSGSILVQEKNVQIASGYSGALSWSLKEDGVLTFTGDGKMKNYSYKSEMPWYAYREQIRHVVLEEGVTSIGAYAFYGMPQLESIEIAETVTSIGDYAFKNAPKIDNVVLPGELTALGDSAFYACTSLRAIDIPASLWTIKPYTFKNCTALAEVTFHEGNLMKISDGAFYNTALTELVLPDCLTILDTFSFKNCAKLTSIELGSGLTELREAVFYATAIPSIEVPEGITKIGPYVFKNCVKLQTIDLPESLTSVGEASFYACSSLQEINLPDAVVIIDDYAFRMCENMEQLHFGSGLTEIGECAFYGCSGLTEIIIPDQVITIKPYAFKTCTALTAVTLGKSVRTIAESAFNTCTGLKEIVFPASLTALGDYCFSGSTRIQKLIFRGNAPAIGNGAFKDLDVYAYYPGGNSSWSASVRQNYGGEIIWKAQ